MAREEAQRRAAGGQYGTVKLLEDTDGDGQMDKSHIWADRLPPCYGVVAARDGVIAICPPDILFLALITIACVGGAAVLFTLGYLVRRRIRYDPHRPPEGDDETPVA